MSETDPLNEAQLSTQPLLDIVSNYALQSMNEEELGGLLFLQDHPEIQVHLHLSPHEEWDDGGGSELLEDRVKSADVVSLEDHGYSPNQEPYLQSIANGELFSRLLARVAMQKRKSFQHRQLRALSGSHVMAVIADIPSGHKIGDEDKTHRELQDMIIEEHGISLEPSRVAHKIEATYMDAREWVMLGELGAKLKSLNKTNDEINKKIEANTLNVYMMVGSFHTTLFHRLKKLGLSPTRSFPNKPHTFDELQTVTRQEMFKILNG